MIGVLIALTAEQVVEQFHWQHEVEAERSALRAEVRYNLSSATVRAGQQRCIDRRLGEIRQVFARKAAGESLGLRGPVARPVLWLGTTGTWDIAISGQALAHMPLDEKLRFSDAFGTYRAFLALRQQEDEIWRSLSLLDDPAILNETDWSRLHAAYADAKAINQRMQIATDYLLQHAALGERPDVPNVTPAVSASERAFCTPILE